MIVLGKDLSGTLFLYAVNGGDEAVDVARSDSARQNNGSLKYRIGIRFDRVEKRLATLCQWEKRLRSGK